MSDGPVETESASDPLQGHFILSDVETLGRSTSESSLLLYCQTSRISPSRLSRDEALVKPPSTAPDSDQTQPEFAANSHARRLFDGIAFGYDFLSQSLSFFQTGVWRRFLVSRLTVGLGDRVLDICTGTGGVAMDIARKTGSVVVGVDLSEKMRSAAHRNFNKAGMAANVSVVGGRAETLSFQDGCIDGICFTYLLRYVDDPSRTLEEIVRVLKPGGALVSLEFGIPENTLLRGLWICHTRIFLPLSTKMLSSGWRYVGGFLGPSITEFYRKNSLEDLRRMWMDAGISNVQVKKLTWGAGIVMWGTKWP